jgi:hypothetical protein
MPFLSHFCVFLFKPGKSDNHAAQRLPEWAALQGARDHTPSIRYSGTGISYKRKKIFIRELASLS